MGKVISTILYMSRVKVTQLSLDKAPVQMNKTF